jgi:hypothetical protein
MLLFARRLRVLLVVGVVLVVGSLGVSAATLAAPGFGPAVSPAVVPLLVPSEAPAEPTSGPTGAVTGGTAVLEGTLNAGAGGVSGYYFAYNVGESCEGGSTTAPGEASGGVVSVEVSGLEPAERYTFCLVATNEFGSTSGAGVAFETKSVPPTIESVSFSGVSDSAAVLAAQIDPRGTRTSYQFEYSSGGAQWVKVPEPAGALFGRGAQGASVRIVGLRASAQYRFRVTAVNANGESGVGGEEETFSTLPVSTPGLPDGRVYEMVSPPDDENAEVYVPEASSFEYSVTAGIFTARPFRVATGGNAVAYQGVATRSNGGEGSGGVFTGSQYLARRSAAGGWDQLSIQPPGYRFTLYQGFSSELTVGIIGSRPAGNTGEELLPPLSPEAPGDSYGVLYSRLLSEAAYRPLFTATPPNRSPSSFAVSQVLGVRTTPAFAGMSADGSQVLFEANDTLLQGDGSLERELAEDVEQEVREGKNKNYLYDSVDGRLSLVDVLPDGRVESDATFGAAPLGEVSHNAPDFEHVISADGRRVFWTALGTGVVYVREDGSSTVQVSAGAGPAQFWTATGDGRYVFYTEGGQLYRFDTEHDARKALTAASSGVEGVVGVSENGEDVYFAANGELAPGATGGQPNLYLVHAGGTAAASFIATLSPEDGVETGPFRNAEQASMIGDWVSAPGYRTAEVTSDGGSVVFMSDRSLSVQGFPGGYPNQGQAEVYLYDAGEAKLFCVSCSPSGEPGTSGFVPIGWSSTYVPQWVSQDGSRVFFDSSSSLASQDVNGQQDVYEWEREGAGSCGVGTGANGGCLYLISGGRSSAKSYLVGVSESGDDVFFVTRGQLTPEDDNEAFDLYDARVGGVVRAPSACAGVACLGALAAAPGFSTPASLGYGGSGNASPSVSPGKAGKAVKPKPRVLTQAQKLAAALKVCRKLAERRRAVCEKAARGRYRPVGKAKRASGSAMKGRR